MTIKKGDKIPSVTVKRMGAGGLEDFNLADHVANKKVVIFAVPGAFTPTCTEKHLPSYLKNAEALKAKGIDEIVCVAVNDPFVAKQWGMHVGAEGKITIVPDGTATYTKALGLNFDGSGAGLGTRSKRYSMIVNKGVVESLEVEDKPGDMIVTGAEACLVKLG